MKRSCTLCILIQPDVVCAENFVRLRKTSFSGLQFVHCTSAPGQGKRGPAHRSEIHRTYELKLQFVSHQNAPEKFVLQTDKTDVGVLRF